MQEPINQEQNEPAAAPRKPTYALALTAIVVAIVILAVVAVQFIFNSSYSANLDKLKGMISTASGQLQNGDQTEGATPAGEYRFYATLNAQVDNLSSILDKMNAAYPLFFFRTSADAVGLTALSTGIDGLMPKMESLKKCGDEDKAVSNELSKLLSGQSTEGVAKQYADLITRNENLKTTLAGFTLTGSAEQVRAALAKGVDGRGSAMVSLHEYASVTEELAALINDVASPLETKVAKLGDLQKRSDTLSANIKGLDLTVYSAEGGKITEAAATLSARIKIDTDYLGEITPLQSDISAFCAGLESAAPAGKLTAKMAAYMSSISQLKTIQSKLDTVNADKKYEMADRVKIEDLGLTEAGKELLSFEDALIGVNSALTTSSSIEKQIAAIMKDTKSRMTDRVSALDNLLQQNNAIIAAFSVDVPASLKDQLTQYVAGCQERKTFLDAYSNYIIAKTAADGALAISKKGGPGASQAKASYNSKLKEANGYKTAYEASQKKYKPLLDA